MASSGLIRYLVLARFQTAAATAVIPVIGALSASYYDNSIMMLSMDNIVLFSLIFLLGLFMHIYGFVQNEYEDMDVDKRSEHLQKKPLVSGAMGPKQAQRMIAGAFVLLLVIGAYLVDLRLFPMIVLMASVLCGTLYNIYGKRMPLDLVLGGWAGLLLLFGSLCVVDEIKLLPLIFAGAAMLHITFNNSVEGGLKDIATDLRAGVKTLAVKLDVTEKRISSGFIAYSLVVKSIWLVLIFLPFLLFEEWMAWGAGTIPWTMVVLVFPLVAIFYTLYMFLVCCYCCH